MQSRLRCLDASCMSLYRLRRPGADLESQRMNLGFGRIVASEIEEPHMFASLVGGG